MSTRGVVGVVRSHLKGGKVTWRGVYNHSDSYPTSLGRDVWEYFSMQTNLKASALGLLHFDDWRNFQDGGICEYCGKVGLGQPHSINGAMPGFLDGQDVEHCYPDPHAQYHMHDTTPVKDRQFTSSKDCEKHNALFIEWLYIVDVQTREIIIFTHAKGPGIWYEWRYNENKSTGKWTKEPGSKYSNPMYQWHEVGRISIDSTTEPDWQGIEDLGNHIGESMYKLHKEEV